MNNKLDFNQRSHKKSKDLHIISLKKLSVNNCLISDTTADNARSYPHHANIESEYYRYPHRGFLNAKR